MNPKNILSGKRYTGMAPALALLLMMAVGGHGTPLQAQLVRQPNTTLKMPDSLTVSSYKRESAFSTNLSFDKPIAIVNVPGDNNTLFIVEKSGKIQRVTNLSTSPVKNVFLDLTTKVSHINNEEGLLGMVFHPQYASNGYFYVFYVTPGTTAPNRKNVLARYSRQSASTANPNSEQIMISQPDDAANHNGGDLHFGADGYLYISLGDEGRGNGDLGNSQRIDKDFYSGIIRIDVDRKAANLEPNSHTSIQKVGGVALYKVPADNPFVGTTTFLGNPVDPTKVRTEFWAVGLRNPWRFSFDPPTNRLFVGDVGQDNWEEVDIVIKGGNYGWNYREGKHIRPGLNASDIPPGYTSIDPIFDYFHSTKPSAVIGGVVYRGSKLPGLKGQYIFSDAGMANNWTLKETPSGWVQTLLFKGRTVALGFDPANGDVLMADDNQSKIWRVVADSSSASTLPSTLTGTGAFANLADLTPNAGVVPFTPRVTFWSDEAKKQRWFSVPNLADKITFANDGPWSFPQGTVWIKHFNLLMDRRDPSSARRLETRFLVKGSEGTYGVTYRWNDAQTEANLVATGGVDQDFNIIDENGVSRVQHWHFPSRDECLSCHTEIAGPPLGFDTRQLNADQTYGSTVANQLTAMSNAGYFTAAIPNPSTLPAYANSGDENQSLEFRARSYLAVNCVQCHQAGGSAPTDWDARAYINLLSAKILQATPVEDHGDNANRIVVPGDLNHSVLLQKIAASGGFSRMPPLATFELDQKGISLISRWIQDELKNGYSVSINAGGAGTGIFASDIGFKGGSVVVTNSTIDTAGVANAAPKPVYQSKRRGTFSYTLGGLYPGRQYVLRLHFAETQYLAANKRVFDVKVNGDTVLSHLDIFSEAGAQNRALVKELTATPDSLGNIVVSTAAVTGIPEMSGIQSLEYRNAVQAVNAGGPAAGGFIADTGIASGGNPKALFYTLKAINTSGVVNAAAADVYRTYRAGQTLFTLSGLQSGMNYQLILHFMEPSATGSGERLFDVKVNGVTSISNLDIFAETGSKHKALTKQIGVVADANGQIKVQLINKTSSKVAVISALEIRN